MISFLGLQSQLVQFWWELAVIIDQEVSQTEPMVEGRKYYIANDLPVGTEVYKSEEPEVIYAKHNDTFIKYGLMEK